MAKYTLKLRDYVESFTYGKEMSIDERITKAIPELFDFKFPWYALDKSGLREFQEMFIKHFYMEEIGSETIGLFKLRLSDVLNTNMSYWSQLYESTKWEINPLINHEFTSETVTKQTSEGTTSHSSVNELKQTQTGKQQTQGLSSDTPQINYAGQDFANALSRADSETEQDATNKGSDTGSANSEATFKDDTKRTDKGFTGSKSREVALWRENIVNINRQIIEKCEPLFMGIFDTSDFNFNYFERRWMQTW